MNNYPYPKLRKDLNDYITSSIDFDAEIIDNGSPFIILQGEFNLQDDEIQFLIDEGYANFCLCLKCIATNRCEFSEVVQKFQYKIVKADYSDEIVVTPGVIMKEKFEGYCNNNLNEDYTDSFVILPKGAMIAETDKFLIKLERKRIESLESICDFVKGKEFNYRCTENKIEISLPGEIYDNSNALRNKNCSLVFTSLYVFPVIQAVIQQHWIEEPDDYSDSWYVSLQDLLDTLYPEGIGQQTAFKITRDLLEEMLYESTDNLVRYYGDKND